MEQMKNKNTFLVACVSCIVILMTFCYFGINTSLKATYSAIVCPSGTSSQMVFDKSYCVSNNATIVSNSEVNSGKSCRLSYSESYYNSNMAGLAAANYEFINWTTDTSGNKIANIAKVLYDTATLVDGYCIFDKVDASDTYTIYYNTNGGTCSTCTDGTKTYGVDYKITSAIPVHSDSTKVFKEWNTQANGKGVSYKSGSVYKEDKDLILYAIYEVPANVTEYTITYDLKGGSMTSATTATKSAGVDYTIVNEVPTKTNYNFGGWNTMSNGSGTTYQPGAVYKDDKNLTLYAQWTEKQSSASTTISLTEKSAVYNGSPIVANTATTNSTGTVTYAYYSDSSCSTKTKTSTGAASEGAAPIDAGTYYVKATVAAVSGFNSASTGCVKHTITKKSISVSWGSTTSFTYDGNEHAPTASVSTNVSGETMTLSVTKQKNVGSHTATASCSSIKGGRVKCENYDLSNKTKDYKIIEASKEENDPPTPSEETYKATFNANGGVLTGDSSKTCTATSGSSCTISGLPTAKKDGYTFNGFSTSSSCTSGSKDKVTLSKNTEFYACYTANETPKGDTPKDDDIKNPSTGDIAIALIWFVGLLAIGYSFYYFKSVKEN